MVENATIGLDRAYLPKILDTLLEILSDVA